MVPALAGLAERIMFFAVDEETSAELILGGSIAPGEERLAYECSKVAGEQAPAGRGRAGVTCERTHHPGGVQGHEWVGPRQCDGGGGRRYHLRRILSEYESHHNQHRPHRSLHGAAPLTPPPEPVDLEQYRVTRQARVGGLISEYRLIA